MQRDKNSYECLISQDNLALYDMIFTLEDNNVYR